MNGMQKKLRLFFESQSIKNLVYKLSHAQK